MRRFLLLLPLFALGCDPAPKTAPRLEPPALVLPASVTELTPDEAERFLAGHPEAQILDARTLDEWRNQGHIANARLFDWLHGKATLDAVAKLDKTQPALVYCAIGGRARLLAAEMATLGFAEVKVLQGGFNAWVTAGKAVAK